MQVVLRVVIRTEEIQISGTPNLRHAIAGILILLMILVTILNGFGLLSFAFKPLWIAGLAGWLAGLILFVDTSRVLKIQVSVLFFVGIGLIVFASFKQAEIDLDAIISANTGLLSMIAAVGFLRLVVLPASPDKSALPVGTKAFLQTLIGLNIASSIINISAPILIADRIHQVRPLQRFTTQTFVRIFCGVSSWSPFFGAMAVVLTYVKDASLGGIIVAGLPFTLVGFLLVYVEARFRHPREVENFVGYPTHFSALKLPVILILVVIFLSSALAQSGILVIISFSALLVTAVTLLVRFGSVRSAEKLKQHVTQGLPAMVNELTLFLAAGVLAAGISALISQGILTNPFTEFTPFTAAKLLAIMWLFAVIGIHPVIMISAFSPMILTLDPDPQLLATTFLIAWNLGTCSSPLSGTNLVFQGRYGMPGWKTAMWNWPYAIVMLIVATLWLQVSGDFQAFLLD